uniref:Uncharacterized protein n=1 Tax=Romanomermis culicivorax TaxID=13658 RepID=A0A915IUB5_ROMCU
MGQLFAQYISFALSNGQTYIIDTKGLMEKEWGPKFNRINRDMGKDLQAIRLMTHDLSQHADRVCGTGLLGDLRGIAKELALTEQKTTDKVRSMSNQGGTAQRPSATPSDEIRHLQLEMAWLTAHIA